MWQPNVMAVHAHHDSSLHNPHKPVHHNILLYLTIAFQFMLQSFIIDDIVVAIANMSMNKSIIALMKS